MAKNKKFDIDDIKINLKNTQKKHTLNTNGARSGGNVVNGFKIPKLSPKQKQLLEKTTRKYGVVIPSYTELRKMAVTPSAQKTLAKTLNLRTDMSMQHPLYTNLSMYDYKKRAVFRANLLVMLAKLGLYSNIEGKTPENILALLNINIFKYDYSREIKDIITSYENLTAVDLKSGMSYADKMDALQPGKTRGQIISDNVTNVIAHLTKYFDFNDVSWNHNITDPSTGEVVIDEFDEYVKDMEKLLIKSDTEVTERDIRELKQEFERKKK